MVEQSDCTAGSSFAASNHSAKPAFFHQALELEPRDLYVRGALADLYLDLGQPQQIPALLNETVSSDAVLLRLARAESALASPSELRKHIEMLDVRFEEAHRRGDFV